MVKKNGVELDPSRPVSGLKDLLELRRNDFVDAIVLLKC